MNFFGALRVTDRLLPTMRQGRRIVMVSSGLGAAEVLAPPLRSRFLDSTLIRDELIALMESFVRDVAAGVHAEKGWPSSAYRVSKVGLNALVRVLARELRDESPPHPRQCRFTGMNPYGDGGQPCPQVTRRGCAHAGLAGDAPAGWTDGRLFRGRARSQLVALGGRIDPSASAPARSTGNLGARSGRRRTKLPT